MVGDFGIRTYHQGSAVLCLFTTMRLNLTGSPDHLRLMQEEHEPRTTRGSAVLGLYLCTTIRLNLIGSPDHLRLMQEEHDPRTSRVSERRIDGTRGRCVVGLLKAS